MDSLGSEQVLVRSVYINFGLPKNGINLLTG